MGTEFVDLFRLFLYYATPDLTQHEAKPVLEARSLETLMSLSLVETSWQQEPHPHPRKAIKAVAHSD